MIDSDSAALRRQIAALEAAVARLETERAAMHAALGDALRLRIEAAGEVGLASTRARTVLRRIRGGGGDVGTEES